MQDFAHQIVDSAIFSFFGEGGFRIVYIGDANTDFDAK